MHLGLELGLFSKRASIICIPVSALSETDPLVCWVSWLRWGGWVLSVIGCLSIFGPCLPTILPRLKWKGEMLKQKKHIQTTRLLKSKLIHTFDLEVAKSFCIYFAAKELSDDVVQFYIGSCQILCQVWHCQTWFTAPLCQVSFIQRAALFSKLHTFYCHDVISLVTDSS